jgi:hypothetical protein
MKYILILLLALPVVGCASTEDRLATNKEKCASFGFTKGEQLSNCLLQLSQQDAERSERRSAAMRAAGAALLSQSAPPQRTFRSTNCTRLGNHVNCTTY